MQTGRRRGALAGAEHDAAAVVSRALERRRNEATMRVPLSYICRTERCCACAGSDGHSARQACVCFPGPPLRTAAGGEVVGTRIQYASEGAAAARAWYELMGCGVLWLNVLRWLREAGDQRDGTGVGGARGGDAHVGAKSPVDWECCGEKEAGKRRGGWEQRCERTDGESGLSLSGMTRCRRHGAARAEGEGRVHSRVAGACR